MDSATVIDGPLGTLIPAEHQQHELWSTYTLLTTPQAIKAIHEKYISAGSQLITTATYQISKPLLAKYFPSTSYEKVLDLAISAAREAVGLSQVQIAGSVGPYGAVLHDGSEYTGNYHGISDQELEQFHIARVQKFEASSDIDVIAVETIPSFQEVQVLIKLIKKKNFWLSLSCNEQGLVDGTPIEEVLKILPDNCIAVGVNCCEFSKVFGNLSKINSCGKPVVIYPNVSKFDVKLNQWEPNRIDWQDFITKLAPFNVKYIGCCCGGGYSDIECISKILKHK